MILADAEGRTLYAFTNDVDGQSTCYDECAVNWPALTIAADEEVFAGEGVSSTWLGSVDRDDDSTQITYSGRPLYYFAADAAPGDTAGQGVGGVWFVVGADGQLVGAPEASDQPSDEASDEADY
jgi:predicted lipoprotein with Yx(FWY)xxD motif